MNEGPMTGKRNLDGAANSQPASKRAQFGSDIDLETLVSQIHQSTSGADNPAQLTIEEIEGALASFQSNQALPQDAATHANTNSQTGRSLVSLVPAGGDPASAGKTGRNAQTQLSEPLRHSDAYNHQIRSQLDVQPQPPKENGSAVLQLRSKMLRVLDSLACQVLEALSTPHY